MNQKNLTKCFAVIVVQVFSAMAQAEMPVFEWTRQVGASSSVCGQGVAVDAAGNAYVTGCTGGDLDGNSTSGYSDMFLIKYATDGTRLWTRQLGSSNASCSGESVSVDAAGNVYVAGYTSGDLDGNSISGYFDMFLTKYDPSGDKLWTQLLGSPDYEHACSVSVDAAGNAYVTGYTDGDLDGNTNGGRLPDYEGLDAFLTKYATDGSKLWTRQLGGEGDDWSESVSVDSNGNAYIAVNSSHGLDSDTGTNGSTLSLVKYSKDGCESWIRQIGGQDGVSGADVSVDAAGNVYVTGGTDHWIGDGPHAGTGEDYIDVFLTKFATDGTQMWTRQRSGGGDLIGMAVSVDAAGNAYVVGNTDQFIGSGFVGAPEPDLFLIKFSSDGELSYEHDFGSPDADYGFDISSDTMGNTYIAGITFGIFPSGEPHACSGPFDESEAFLTKISSVPEPTVLALAAMGMIGLIAVGRSDSRNRRPMR